MDKFYISDYFTVTNYPQEKYGKYICPYCGSVSDIDEKDYYFSCYCYRSMPKTNNNIYFMVEPTTQPNYSVTQNPYFPDVEQCAKPFYLKDCVVCNEAIWQLEGSYGKYCQKCSEGAPKCQESFCGRTVSFNTRKRTYYPNCNRHKK